MSAPVPEQAPPSHPGHPGPASPWPEAGPALPLEAAAGLLGSYRWIERRLFEVVGGWVATEAVDEVRLFFDVQSRLHAWHAELWGERLPVLDWIDPDELTLAPSAEVDVLFGTLGGSPPAGRERQHGSEPSAGGTLLRLVGFTRVVVPRLVAQYDFHLRHSAPVADAAVARCLRLVLADDIEAWRQGEALVQSLVRRPHDVAVVTAHQQELESPVAGTLGLVPWPTSGRWPGPDQGEARAGGLRPGVGEPPPTAAMSVADVVAAGPVSARPAPEPRFVPSAPPSVAVPLTTGSDSGEGSSGRLTSAGPETPPGWDADATPPTGLGAPTR